MNRLRMRHRIVFILIFLIGCGTIPKEENTSIELFFCHENNCADRLYQNFLNAENRIYCSFYSIDIERIIKLLIEKSRKIDIKIVANGRNYKNNLPISNLRLTKRNNHNKFCIIDDKIVVTGSFNPTIKSTKDFNNLLIIQSLMLSKNYLEEFNEQWNGLKDKETTNREFNFGDITVTNIFCPDDSCGDSYLRILNSAKSNVNFMVFSFTNEDVANLLLSKNIDIKGIFENSQANNKYSQYERLRNFGMNVRLYNGNFTLHHKVFIIDNKTVITGSANPTINGFFSNDENILVIDNEEIAYEYLKEFERIWNVNNGR